MSFTNRPVAHTCRPSRYSSSGYVQWYFATSVRTLRNPASMSVSSTAVRERNRSCHGAASA